MSARKKRDGDGRAKIRFLEAYRQTGRVVEAARIADIHRNEHYRWLDNDGDYARAFTEADKQSVDILESEAQRRAVEGVRELVLVNGKPVRDPDAKDGSYLYKHRYSDVLLMFLMKAKKPEKYRDNFVPMGEDDGERIAGKDHLQLLREQRARMDSEIRELEQRGQGPDGDYPGAEAA